MARKSWERRSQQCLLSKEWVEKKDEEGKKEKEKLVATWTTLADVVRGREVMLEEVTRRAVVVEEATRRTVVLEEVTLAHRCFRSLFKLALLSIASRQDLISKIAMP